MFTHFSVLETDDEIGVFCFPVQALYLTLGLDFGQTLQQPILKFGPWTNEI